MAEAVRCAWAGNDPAYIRYHDSEWGVPSHDDRHLFEMLILEGAQAGLSWLTILRKRDAYRLAYDNFDAELVARYSTSRIEQLLSNAGIVRNRLKIESSIRNAKGVLAIRDEFGSLDSYLWSFVDGKPIRNQFAAMSDVPARTDLSDRMSRELKQRGFGFVGSTILYAYMQATGMVDDHVMTCFKRTGIVAQMQ